MHIRSFEVAGLFNRYDRKIEFPRLDTSRPALLILHGQNGVGKTTALRMVDGIMRMDFDIFRAVPFASAQLSMSDDSFVTVRSVKDADPGYLEVTYKDVTARLHPSRQGGVAPLEEAAVAAYRERFSTDTDAIKFELVSADRLLERKGNAQEEKAQFSAYIASMADGVGRRVRPEATLNRKIQDFLNAAQANYRQFFATSEPDLFQRILSKLTELPSVAPPRDLLTRLQIVKDGDREVKERGLVIEPWDFDKLQAFLAPGDNSEPNQYVTAVVGSYVEALEERHAQRQMLVERLRAFERILGEFLLDKSATITGVDGLRIRTKDGQVLREDQLSSGEYHLLYLLVSALITRRRGSVIAIDEPEMSMHIAWQRKLVSALIECASGAQPQLLLATHSPDIASEHPEALVEFGGGN